LSILRIVIVVPIVLLLLEDDPALRWWAVVLMGAAALTDTLDGYFARLFNQESTFGRLLDPVADKVAVAAVVVTLALRGLLPLWFLALAAVRDVLILAGGLYVKKVKGMILQSTFVGKAAVTVVAALLIVVAIPLQVVPELKNGLLFLSSLMLIASFAAYFKRFVSVMSEEGKA
jgi:CDP-diacylglycerol--glycerol-3-phosphate 3-phosphatidyltransferase